MPVRIGNNQRMAPQPALNVRDNARSNKPNEKLNTEAISEARRPGDDKARKTQTDARCGTDSRWLN